MSRFGYVMLTYFVVLFLLFTAFLRPSPRLAWNASASAPIGLYAIHRAPTVHVGDLVVIAPPAALAGWLSRRHYLPERVLLVKHVAAVAGQRVCRTGAVITIDGRTVGRALGRDRRGCPLPAWSGCRLLKPGELFVMNPTVPDSLDGRYFGPLPVSTVLGRATPILTRDAPTAPLRWRPSTPDLPHPKRKA